jgi:adenylate cyclase, class 2
MATEIEAKFKVENIEEIKQKIATLGAVLKGTKQQKDTYYKHPVRKELQGQPTYLRIRTTEGKSKTAMHYKLKDYEWEELETSLEDGDILRKIFENLGFAVDVEIVKKRETWEIPDGEIVLDDVEGLGNFMEIEVNSKEALESYCDKLGLDLKNNKLQDISYADLLKAKK